MQSSKLIWVIILLCGCLSSCFKEEPLNAECDIESVWVHTDNPDDFFFNRTDTIINVPYSKSEITFYVKRNSDITHMAPMFKITEGATIEPANGSLQDFSRGPVTYKVTSQDKQWNRVYNVAFQERSRTVTDTLKFDFDNYELDKEYGKFYVWYDKNEDGKTTYLWATGNPGFRYAYSTMKDPDRYPTTPIAEGIDGASVKLETRSTGAFGVINNKRIAAGNLFYGFFDTKYVLTETMKSTNFGHPFDKTPIKFEGYYRYKSGDKYQDKNGNEIPGKKDQGSIYSVMYRNHDNAGNEVMLHGDDVLTNPHIVAVARMVDVTGTEDWTKFELDFKYFDNIDETLLNNYGYNIAIVFSSSYEGDHFEGAVGSTLLIDKVRLICKKTE